jgi:hypothetical protein
MDLLIHLPPEIETKLREQAIAEAKSPEELALAALVERLIDGADASGEIQADSWLEAFRAFTAASPNGSVDADVTRDSIYEGRGG